MCKDGVNAYVQIMASAVKPGRTARPIYSVSKFLLMVDGGH